MEIINKTGKKDKNYLIIKKYKQYLLLEKSFSPNTLAAYLTDLVPSLSCQSKPIGLCG